MAGSAIELHYPDRAAPALLGGVLYQALWSAIRALNLSPDEVLVLEGDEDVVTAIIVNGVVVQLTHEQIKNLDANLTARKAPVYETVFAFLCSFRQLTLEGRRCAFVFTSNASLGRQETDDEDNEELSADERIEIDLLAAWSKWTTATSQAAAQELIAAVKGLVERYVDTACRERAPGAKGRTPSITAKRVREAVAFLDAAPGRWATFLSAVSWNVDQGSAREMFERIAQLVAADPRTNGFPTEPMAYRLVVEMLGVGARPDSDNRRFTSDDLQALAQITREELLAWAEQATPLRLWQLDVDARFQRTEERLTRLETAVRRGDAPQVDDAVLERYVAWSKSETSTFRIFGEDTPFDIGHALPLEAEIGRIAFGAMLLLEAEPTRIALTGGGGAGKSTLLRAITHRAAATGAVVLRVRLHEVRTYMTQGVPFALALARCVSDRAAVSESDARAIVAAAEVLLADGLDECGDSAERIAYELHSYASARSDLRVMVATRSSHAHLAAAPFVQARLLPLAPHVLREAMQRLLRAAGAEDAAIVSATDRLPALLGEARLTATPLNLVLALDLARHPRAGRVTRTSLFVALFSSMRARPLLDRDAPEVDAEHATRALAAFGACLLDTPTGTAHELTLAAVSALGEKGLAAVPRLDAALRFWEHRSVLERGRASSVEQLGFTHDFLRDFAAAQWVVVMPAASRRAWLTSRGRTARETSIFVVAMGGDEVLRELLDVSDDPADLPTQAEAAWELGTPSPATLERLTEAAVHALASPIPVICERAARAVIPLVSFAPDQFGAAARPALDGPGSWNELGAMCILLAAGGANVPTDRLLALVARKVGGDSSRDNEQHDPEIEAKLWHKLLVPALDHLVRARRELVTPLIEQLVQGRKNISAGDYATVIGKLQTWGFTELLEANLAQSKTDGRRFRSYSTDEWFADAAFLLMLGRVFGPASERTQVDSRCLTIGRLIGALNFADAPAGNWAAAVFVNGGVPVETVVRGVAFAARLSPELLAAEAKRALGTIVPTTPPTSFLYNGLFDFRIDSPRELEWIRTAELDLPLDPLFEALSIGGWLFPNHALMLILHHKEQDVVGTRLARELRVDSSLAIDAAATDAAAIFGVGAGDVLASTLHECLTSATARLLPALARLEPTADRTHQLVKAALSSGEPTIVSSAAEAAAECDDLAVIEGVRAGLKTWLAVSSEAQSTDGRTEARSVVEVLLGTLAKKKGLSYEALVPLIQSGPASGTASRHLVALIATVPCLVERAVCDIADGVLPDSVLVRLLEEPDQVLKPFHDKLLDLASHDSVALRAAVVQALGTATWISRDDAQRVLRARLTDKDAGVRTDAQRALEGAPPPRGFSRLLRSRSRIG